MPRTRSGKVLLECVVDGEWRSDWHAALDPASEGDLPRVIDAIEAEAAAECEERNRRLQETLAFHKQDGLHVLSDEGYAYVQDEAVSAYAARLREAVEGLPPFTFAKHHLSDAVDRAVVLRLIDETRP